MPKIEIDALLSAAFLGGEVRRRELRLSADQADYIRAHYPVRLTPLSAGGDKFWYEITFQGVDA